MVSGGPVRFDLIGRHLKDWLFKAVTRFRGVWDLYVGDTRMDLSSGNPAIADRTSGLRAFSLVGLCHSGSITPPIPNVIVKGIASDGRTLLAHAYTHKCLVAPSSPLKTTGSSLTLYIKTSVFSYR